MYQRFLSILLIAAVVLLAAAPTADARGPRARERAFGQQTELRHSATSYDARRAALNERYPRYIGGIHVRELDRFGIPPGDHGPRGNGFYPTPW
jgi:hypothetical protein